MSDTKTYAELSTPNAYALPSGEVVNLPEHCRADAERFTLRDGSVVWAARVGSGSPEAAARLAARLPAPRKA